MTSVNDSLPEVVGFVSGTLLFWVDGERYAGHYHSNGWFYCDERRVWLMAAGPEAKPIETCDLRATHWEYLR